MHFQAVSGSLCEMSKSFDELVEIMAKLRSEAGCPWDRKQTHETLKPYLIEESHEVLEAIDKKDPAHLSEELGDLFLQVLFHAQIAKEKGDFSIEDVLKGLADKLTQRHPHVFGGEKAESAEEVLKNWEKNKLKEKKGKRLSYLEGVPPSLPALMRAQKIQKKASRAGFDWESREGVILKFEEEWKEFEEALTHNAPEAVEEELGDLFFTLVNLARFVKADSEQVLRSATEKFILRFQAMENELRKEGKALDTLSPAELDALWNRVKNQ